MSPLKSFGARSAGSRLVPARSVASPGGSMPFIFSFQSCAVFKILNTVYLALFLCLLSLSLSGCDYNARDYRLRITANVEVNGKIYTGSSVQTFHCRPGGGLWGSMDVGGCTAKGEAVVVEAGIDKYLFALFSGNGHDLTTQVKMYDAALGRSGGHDLSPDEMPRLVTFDDVRKPSSVRQVNPTKLGETFGKGARVNFIKVERELAFVTRGRIKKVLPWLDKMGRRSLAGTTVIFSNALPNVIFRSDFLRD